MVSLKKHVNFNFLLKNKKF